MHSCTYPSRDSESVNTGRCGDATLLESPRFLSLLSLLAIFLSPPFSQLLFLFLSFVYDYDTFRTPLRELENF